MGGGMMGDGMMAAMGIWAFLLIAVLVAVLVLAVLAGVWLVRRLREDRRTDAEDSALAVLRRRYAAGEIDEEEYRHRRAELTR